MRYDMCLKCSIVGIRALNNPNIAPKSSRFATLLQDSACRTNNICLLLAIDGESVVMLVL